MHLPGLKIALVNIIPLSADEKVLARKIRFGGQVRPETPQARFVPRRRDVRDVDFAPLQLLHLLQGQVGHGVGGRVDAQANQDFREVEADRLGPEDVLLEVPDGFDDRRGEKMDLFRDLGQQFHGVEDQGRRGVREGGVLPREVSVSF